MADSETNPFYETPLGRCILAGDITGVMDMADSMTADERSAALIGVQALMIDRWKLVRKLRVSEPDGGGEYDYAHANRLFRAVEMARFMCTPDALQADYWMHIGVQDIAAYQRRYRPAVNAKNLEKQLRGEHGWHYRHHIHRAVAAGLLPRPDTEEYLESLFFGDLRQESNVILKHVEADPGMTPHLLALFDREGTSDASFAAVEKYCHDPALYWSTAFITLSQRGVYTRAQLLDKTLGTLACDWPQFKAGWFSRFHEMLAPTVDEMAAFAPRYLALCHSRIAPTVSLAVEAVTALYQAGAVADEPLCDALQPVVNSAVKGRVVSALELLGQVVKRSPERAHGASAIALHALAHTAADLQKKTIACLKGWGLDAAGQQAASAYLPLVAAVNQPALRTLLGQAAAPPASVERSARPDIVPREAPAAVPMSPLDASRAIVPLAQLTDLIEHIAYVFENLADVDAWERAAEALVRMSPIPKADHAAFSALKKRAKRFTWDEKPLGFAMARLMACALGETVDVSDMAPQSGALESTRDFIGWRAQSLVAQATLGLGLAPLSAPTHQSGFIDPKLLRGRLDAWQRAGAKPSAREQELASLRVLPAPGQAIGFSGNLGWSVSSSDGEYVFHSLHINMELPGGHGATPGLQESLTSKHLTLGRWQTERDEACIRFAASLQPNDLEPFFAEAAHALGNNLNWWEATWQNRAYLDVLLQPTTALTPMAYLTLAVALAGKEPGQTALAVDVLVNSLREGRLLPGLMADTMAEVWSTPLVTGARLAKSLTSAAQASPFMPGAVYRLLCAMLVAKTEAPRKDCAPLLELMLELQLAHGLCLPLDTRHAFAGMTVTGKAKAALRALLA